MNKKLIALSSLAALLALPLVSLAVLIPAEPASLNITVPQLINILFDIFWPVVVAFVIVMFALAGFIFMTAQGDPAKIGTARAAVIWGVVGVIVILLAFSIILIARTQLGV